MKKTQFLAIVLLLVTIIEILWAQSLTNAMAKDIFLLASAFTVAIALACAIFSISEGLMAEKKKLTSKKV